MIRSLLRFFEDRSPASGEDESRRAVDLATAVLLVELMRSDFHDDDEERRVVEDAVRRLTGAGEAEARELMDLAEKESAESVSLFEFTRVLHHRLSPGEKLQVVEQLWRVAFADGRLDDHEAHLMRKLQGLLHIPRRDFTRAKVRAREARAWPPGPA